MRTGSPALPVTREAAATFANERGLAYSKPAERRIRNQFILICASRSAGAAHGIAAARSCSGGPSL
jgi:hypothetical protein